LQDQIQRGDNACFRGGVKEADTGVLAGDLTHVGLVEEVEVFLFRFETLNLKI
jgi:hypothetical protein